MRKTAWWFSSCFTKNNELLWGELLLDLAGVTPGCVEECFSDGQCVMGSKAAKTQQIGVGWVRGRAYATHSCCWKTHISLFCLLQLQTYCMYVSVCIYYVYVCICLRVCWCIFMSVYLCIPTHIHRDTSSCTVAGDRNLSSRESRGRKFLLQTSAFSFQLLMTSYESPWRKWASAAEPLSLSYFFVPRLLVFQFYLFCMWLQ